MNGRPWTADEIAALVSTIVEGGSTIAFARKLDRTHIAVRAKAHRLGLPLKIERET